MPNRILVMTDNPTDAETLRDVLGKARDGPFEIEWVRRLCEGVERLQAGAIDAVLVDLSLPDSRGMGTFDQLFAVAPQIPIMTLSELNDESDAMEAVRRGAQGYLTKGHFCNYLVPQALRNIILHKQVEEALNVERIRAEITLNSISDGVIGTDMRGDITYLNIAAERITGWPREEARGRPIREVFQIINGKTHQPDRNPVDLVLLHGKPTGLNAEALLIRRDGSTLAIGDSAAPIRDKNDRICGAVTVFHDVSATRAMAVKMEHLAQHDFLTDLPNRVLLHDRIKQGISLAKRHRKRLVVLFLDLDNFKHINDSLGHAVGDKLLQSVSRRLCACVRRADTVSRLGGDEFVILAEDEEHVEDTALIAEKVINSLLLPHQINDLELYITVSIGISVYPDDGQTVETLLKNADIAMYSAKEKGRNTYQFFEERIDA